MGENMPSLFREDMEKHPVILQAAIIEALLRHGGLEADDDYSLEHLQDALYLAAETRNEGMLPELIDAFWNRPAEILVSVMKHADLEAAAADVAELEARIHAKLN